MTLAPGLVAAADVAEAVRARLVAGLPALLPVLDRPLPLPTSYALVPSVENVRRVQGVVLAVMVSGLAADPQETGADTWLATWSVDVVAMCEDTLQTPIGTAAGDYAAAIRAVLLADRSLSGFASHVDWQGETVDLMGDEKSPRLIGVATVSFAVAVDDTTAPRIGAGWPRVPVDTVVIDVDARPLD